jgi:hypothetical protein
MYKHLSVIEVSLRTYINCLPFSTGMACFKMVSVEFRTPLAKVAPAAKYLIANRYGVYGWCSRSHPSELLVAL